MGIYTDLGGGECSAINLISLELLLSFPGLHIGTKLAISPESSRGSEV